MSSSRNRHGIASLAQACWDSEIMGWSLVHPDAGLQVRSEISFAMNQQWPSLADLPDEAEAPQNAVTALDFETATATDLLLAGLQIARAGGLNEAAEIFAKAILKEPQCAEAYEALATVLVPLGQLEFASRAKAKAISLGYNSAPSWEMLGDMLFGLGKFVDAAEAFHTAVELDPAANDAKEKLAAALAQSAPETHGAASAAGASRAKDDADLFGPDFLSAEPISAPWQDVNIVTITPDGNPHSAAFADLAAGLASALQSLGVRATRRSNSFMPSGVNLLLGAHLVGSQEMADRIPGNTVVINLEQISGFDVGGRPVYLSLLKRLPVWDYSMRNIVELRRMTQNPNIRHFSIGYVPEMRRSLPPSEQPIDVLFYGSTNERRSAVLKALAEAGLNVKYLFSVYGDEREQAIADAKVVLNMHFYEDSIHEIVRTSYLLANGKAVVSECGPKTEIDEDIRAAMIAVPYSELVRSCVALVRDEPRRRMLERKAFEIFANRDQGQILRDTISATEFPITV
ncbi:MAG: tetratricopeptide repeat protein [Hyphomicrobium sp.]|uniref:tetratricopeptide repeat protein n=1 Tax=Hyphomicrobium sp. TaxID=82 RepID=UPI0039E4C649